MVEASVVILDHLFCELPNTDDMVAMRHDCGVWTWLEWKHASLLATLLLF